MENDMDVSTMKVAELKKELKSRGLTITGNKSELVERLQLALMGSSTDAQDDDPDLLADANALLGPDDSAEVASTEEAVKTAVGDKKAGEPAQQKKISIKRDTALPTVAATDEKLAAEAKPATEVPEEIAAKTADSHSTDHGHVKITPPSGDTTAKTTVLKTTTSVSPDKPAENTPKPIDKATVDNPPKAQMTDAERAKARAERFKITAPTNDDEKKSARAARFGTKAGKIGDTPEVDMETLKKRAERFGSSSSTMLKKLEMQEKINKRKDRFGAVDPDSKKAKFEVNNKLLVDEKLQKRAERFGTANA